MSGSSEPAGLGGKEAGSAQQQQSQDEPLEASSPLPSGLPSQPPASSSLKPPRTGKISFSVDALLSGTRRSPSSTIEASIQAIESKRYRDLIIEHHHHHQQQLPSRELLARLSPQGLVAPFAAHQQHNSTRSSLSQLADSRPNTHHHLIVAKDLSRSSHPTETKEQSTAAISLSPTRLSELRRELLQRQDDERNENLAANERRSVSPVRQRDFDERSGDSEACNRSIEGADDGLMDDEQDTRSEDLNVMDSDDCSEVEQQQRDQDKEKSSPVVPQPIHPGVQRPSGPYITGAGPGGWTSPGFPHSLASFAWLPPPPHPHNPHGHLYNPHGGPTSPNGKATNPLMPFNHILSNSRINTVTNDDQFNA